MNKIRIAVAGAGAIGKAHMDVTVNSPSCTLCAIVDPSPSAVAVANKAGVPLYQSIEELLAKGRPDGLILATPNDRLNVRQRFAPKRTVPHQACKIPLFTSYGAALKH